MLQLQAPRAPGAFVGYIHKGSVPMTVIIQTDRPPVHRKGRSPHRKCLPTEVGQDPNRSPIPGSVPAGDGPMVPVTGYLSWLESVPL